MAKEVKKTAKPKIKAANKYDTSLKVKGDFKQVLGALLNPKKKVR